MNNQTTPSKTIVNEDLNVNSNDSNRTNTIINNLFNSQRPNMPENQDSDDDTSSESTRGMFFDAILVPITLNTCPNMMTSIFLIQILQVYRLLNKHQRMMMIIAFDPTKPPIY